MGGRCIKRRKRALLIAAVTLEERGTGLRQQVCPEVKRRKRALLIAAVTLEERGTGLRQRVCPEDSQ